MDKWDEYLTETEICVPQESNDYDKYHDSQELNQARSDPAKRATGLKHKGDRRLGGTRQRR